MARRFKELQTKSFARIETIAVAHGQGHVDIAKIQGNTLWQWAIPKLSRVRALRSLINRTGFSRVSRSAPYLDVTMSIQGYLRSRQGTAPQ